MNSLENTIVLSTRAKSENLTIFTHLNFFISLLLVLSCVSYLFFDSIAADEVRREFAGRLPPLCNDFLALVKGLGKGETNLLFAAVSALAGYRRLALQIVVALLISAIMVWSLKMTVQRERPRGNSFVSFPSGDAATSTAMAMPIVEAFPPALPAAAVLVAAIAIGRVVVQAHYPSDVLFGIALGLIAGALSIRVCSRFRQPLESRFITRGALLVAGGFCFIPMTGLAGEQITRTLTLCGPVLLLLLLLRHLGQAESGFRKYGSSRWLPYLLVGVIALLYLYTTSASSLWDRDEPRYARAAVEMMRSGSLMVPTFNGEYRLHKPILVYWLMQPFLWLPVKSEVAVRLASVLCFAICCLVTCRLGTLFRSRKTGLVAFAAMAGTPLAIVNGTASTTDSLLLLCTTTAFTIFYYCSARGIKPFDMLPLGVALGSAQLTKGPVGLIVPLFSMFAVSGAKGAGFHKKSSIAIVIGAVLIGTALFFAWFLPANSITNGAFYDFAFKNQVVHRTLSPMEGHGGSILFSLPYYLVVVIAGFFPWVLYLPGGLYVLFSKRYLQSRDRLFLGMWIFPPLILMTAVATKLPHYILPIWPALAILAAISIEEKDGPEVDHTLRRWMCGGMWLFGVMGVLLSAALLAIPWFLPIEGLMQGAVPAGLVVGIMTVAGIREHRANRYVRGAILLFSGMLLLQLTLASSLLPALENIKISPAVAAMVRKNTPPETPVTTFRCLEPSLVFYLDRSVVGSLADEGSVAAWAREKGPGVLILPGSALDEIRGRYGALPLTEIGSKKGLNIGKVRKTELIALKRQGG